MASPPASPNAGFLYVPFAVVSAVLAYRYMDNLREAKADPGPTARATRHVHTWLMAVLYIGTFGSFIGYSAAFPTLLKVVFERPDIALTYGFLGALVGSLSRPLGGRLSDRLGGSVVTVVSFLVMAAAGVVAVVGVQQKSLPIFFASFMVLFVATGVGNGSTYRMIPAIFSRLGARAGGDSALEFKRRAAGAVGIISAVGAFGGFVIPFVYKFAKEEYGSIVPALQVYVGVFVGLAALTWAVYLAARRHDGEGLSRCRRRRTAPTARSSAPRRSTGCRMPCPRCASRRATSRPTGAGCARRAGARRRCSRAPDRLTTPLVRVAAGASSRRRGTRRSTSSHARLTGIQRGARPRRRRGVRRGRPDQREGLHAGQVRPGRAPHAVHRLQRPVLHVARPPPAPTAPSGSTAGSPSRSPTSGARMPCSSSARTPPRRCRHSSSTSPGPGRTVGWSSSTRGAPRRRSSPRTAPASTSPPVPGTDLVVLLALTHVLADEGLVDEEYVRDAHDRLGCRARVGRAVVARARRDGVRHPRRRAARDRPAARGRGARSTAGAGRYVLTGRGVEQSTQGTDGVSAAINLAARPRPRRPPRLGLRPAHRSGQRPGRARARAEERPAARVPDDRRPGGPRARRRGLGRRRRDASPDPACPPSSCCGGSAPRAAPRPCSCTAPTPPSRPRTSPRCASALGRLDLLVVVRRRALGDRPAWPTSCCP